MIAVKESLSSLSTKKSQQSTFFYVASYSYILLDASNREKNRNEIGLCVNEFLNTCPVQIVPNSKLFR